MEALCPTGQNLTHLVPASDGSDGLVGGSAVQMKGRGAWLFASMKRLMAAWSSTSERNTPRFSRRRLVGVRPPLIKAR